MTTWFYLCWQSSDRTTTQSRSWQRHLLHIILCRHAVEERIVVLSTEDHHHTTVNIETKKTNLQNPSSVQKMPFSFRTAKFSMPGIFSESFIRDKGFGEIVKRNKDMNAGPENTPHDAVKLLQQISNQWNKRSRKYFSECKKDKEASQSSCWISIFSHFGFVSPIALKKRIFHTWTTLCTHQFYVKRSQERWESESSLGHGVVLQTVVSSWSPMQSCPVWKGPWHSLALDLCPPPHSSEHGVHSNQELHTPSTTSWDVTRQQCQVQWFWRIKSLPNPSLSKKHFVWDYSPAPATCVQEWSWNKTHITFATSMDRCIAHEQ